MKIRYDVLINDFTSKDPKKKIKLAEWVVDRKPNDHYTIKLANGVIIILMKVKDKNKLCL